MNFSRQQALQCAHISKHVYIGDNNLAPLGNPVYFQVKDPRPLGTSFAGIYAFPEHTIVAYRGTMPNIPDWIKNLKTKLTSTNLGGSIHQGFKEELEAVQPLIIDTLKSQGRQTKPVMTTGHSQGGGIATIAARHLELTGYRVLATYTFAAPRPGDAQFRSSLQSPVYRMEYGNDIVPHVPPPRTLGKLLGGWTMWLASFFANPIVTNLSKMANDSAGYLSVGRLTYAPVSGQLRIDLNEAQEMDLMKERVWGLLRGGSKAIEHHSIDKYIGALEM